MKSLLLKISLIGFFSIITQICNSQVSGSIFKDFNANGTKDNTTTFNEVGLPRVVVNATDASGTSLAVSFTGGGSFTNNTGEYTVTGGTLGQIRLEFVLPDGYTFASNGAIGGTSIMFPSGATQDLAVNTPEDYWNNNTQSDPSMLVPIYKNGAYNGPNSAEGAIVAITNSQGTLTSTAMTPTKTNTATLLEVGATWGNARDKKKDRFFFSSVLKRHAGFGPKGAGGIYIMDNSGSNYVLGGSIRVFL